VHDDNKSNNGQIGQVVAMRGSGKTEDFFLWVSLIILDILNILSSR
jgi:hypothetical protein